MRSVLLLAVAVLCGCSGAVRTVDPSAPSALRDLAERRVDVHLADGQVRPARGLRVAADTTSWVDADTGGLVSVATASVVEVRRRDRAGWSRRVAGRSALVAGLAGAALGAAAGWANGGCLFEILPGSCDPATGERAQAAAAFGIGSGAMSAMYGVVGGAVAGAVVAPQDRYVLARDTAAVR